MGFSLFVVYGHARTCRSCAGAAQIRAADLSHLFIAHSSRLVFDMPAHAVGCMHLALKQPFGYHFGHMRGKAWPAVLVVGEVLLDR